MRPVGGTAYREDVGTQGTTVRGRKENEMRALRCEHGRHLEAPNDEELFEKLEAHVDREHPDRQLGDEQVRKTITADAYEQKEAGEAEPGDELAGTF